MTRAVRTFLHFVFCFAPAAAMFALTLEWARPAAPMTPSAIVVAPSVPAAETPLTLSFDGTTDGPAREMPDTAITGDGRSTMIIIDRDGVSHTLYPQGEGVGDSTPLTDILTRRVAAEARTMALSFDDRLTRSGWVTLGLGLVTLTGGFGLFLFQRRMQERVI